MQDQYNRHCPIHLQSINSKQPETLNLFILPQPISYPLSQIAEADACPACSTALVDSRVNSGKRERFALRNFSQREPSSQYIYMERNKSDKFDYALPTNRQQLEFNPFPLATQAKDPALQDPMFMRYASSIIQVVSEEKMEKSNQLASSNFPHNAVIEISDVRCCGADSKVQSNDYQLAQSNHYNILPQNFKKKNLRKQTLTYNFTNLTTLITLLSRLLAKNIKKTAEILESQSSKKPVANKIINNRASFHSGSTNSTYYEELKSRKQFGAQRKIEMIEQMREGANTIKGWIQFKILMVQSLVLKELQAFKKQKNVEELSPISVSKKEHLIENFYLSDYQHENSLSLAPNLHRFEESLAYTADQNFEFSRKQHTATTPDKLSQDGRPNLSEQKQLFSQNSPSDPKESLVEEYKEHLRKKSKENVTSKIVYDSYKNKIPISKPKELNITEERRYLKIRTNLFQLPIISEQDLRFNGLFKSNELPLKNDLFSPNQPQFSCQNVQSMANQIETANFLFQSTKTKILESSSAQKQSLHSYFTSVRDKYSKVTTQLSKNEHIIQTCKLKSKLSPHRHKEEIQSEAKNNQLTMTSGGTGQERKAPVKIQNYYFPGRQSKNTQQSQDQYEMANEYASKNRLDEVKQVDSILSSYQKETQKSSYPRSARFQESIVSSFAVTEENKIKSIKGTPFPVKLEKSHKSRVNFDKNIEKTAGYEPIERAKASNAVNAYSRKLQPSPTNHQIRPLNHITRKQEQIRSPAQQPIRQMNPYSLSPSSRPVQQEYNPIKIEPAAFQEPKEKICQRVNFNHNHNVYQINQPMNTNNHPKPAINNFNGPYGYPRVNAHHLQQNQQRNQYQYPVQHQERPPSRVFSPQQPLPNYATARDNSEKKVSFLSPQPYPATAQQQIKFIHQPQMPPFNSILAQPIRQYFVTESQNPMSINNKYYTSTVAERVPIFTDPNRQTMRPASQRPRVEPERPHSSSRQSIDRLNIFSNFSPMGSELQGPNVHISQSSRNGSKICRPKSMNEKIHLTLLKNF